MARDVRSRNSELWLSAINEQPIVREPQPGKHFEVGNGQVQPPSVIIGQPSNVDRYSGARCGAFQEQPCVGSHQALSPSVSIGQPPTLGCHSPRMHQNPLAGELFPGPREASIALPDLQVWEGNGCRKRVGATGPQEGGNNDRRAGRGGLISTRNVVPCNFSRGCIYDRRTGIVKLLLLTITLVCRNNDTDQSNLGTRHIARGRVFSRKRII